MSEKQKFPAPAEIREVYDEGRADGEAGRLRSSVYDRPLRTMPFRLGCLAAAYMRGYNHGTQEGLQDRYGDVPSA